ncbi:MAG: hypothetical protein K9N00_00085 [Candidatus Marinimicrobia bacterium]|nr:hypothetical protein [Candidatus Neomarinimicrobiota bacterium]
MYKGASKFSLQSGLYAISSTCWWFWRLGSN